VGHRAGPEARGGGGRPAPPALPEVDRPLPALDLPAEERARYEALAARLDAPEFAAREEAAAALRAALPRSYGVVAARRASPSAEVKTRATRILVGHFEDQALAAYRRAFALALEGDLAAESLCAEGDSSVALESGRGILRLLGDPPPEGEAKAEAEKVGKAVADLDAKPKWITPVVFPLDGALPLERMLAGRDAWFDLDGDGEAERWPWVGPRTGILAWDPEGTGRVASGRDLFGSVTWWLFWRSGYEALAALDDDADGRLAGPELRGIAVWTDADGDGASDPGEVRPATALGIASIAVRATALREGVPANPVGIFLRSGGARPTYDWTPRRADAPTPARAGGHAR
jgi:hypothetical protein